MPVHGAVEPTFTILPDRRSLMYGATARQQSHTPRTTTEKHRSHSAGSMSVHGPRWALAS